jgi:hypothetical protein
MHAIVAFYSGDLCTVTFENFSPFLPCHMDCPIPILQGCAVSVFPVYLTAAASKQSAISEGLYNSAPVVTIALAPLKRSAPQPENRSKKKGDDLNKWPRSGHIEQIGQ